MKSRSALRLTSLLVFAILSIMSACSEDDPAGVEDGDQAVSPLTERYWPLPEEGATWSYLRVEDGVYSPDPDNIQYYNSDLPAGYTEVELLAGEIDVEGTPARALKTEMVVELGNPLQFELELWLNKTAGGIELLGERPGSAIQDSSYAFAEAVPYDWIRFGVTRWVAFTVDYSTDSMLIDDSFEYGEDKYGKVRLDHALGFEYPRTIYDGSDIPNQFPFELYDVDHDTYPDGVLSVSLVGEVIDELDFAYADLGSVVDSIFPQLKEEVIENCKWVRFSLVADLFLSNQRNPNTTPGQNSINETYLPEQALFDEGRRDLSLLLLAPDIGPVAIVNYVDMDKQVKVGAQDEEVFLFQPDLIQTDYLLEYNLGP